MKKVPVVMAGEIVGEAEIDPATSMVKLQAVVINDVLNAIFCHDNQLDHDPELQIKFVVENKKARK